MRQCAHSRRRAAAVPVECTDYNLTWSTDGVINEYSEPCEAIVEGVLSQVAPLGGHEEFSVDGVTYEAFNTSGGLGALCETLQGQVTTLDYKTPRYPGHSAIMKALLNELRLRDRRDVLEDILENALPGQPFRQCLCRPEGAGRRVKARVRPRA